MMLEHGTPLELAAPFIREWEAQMRDEKIADLRH